jgi:hypothetical protein
MRDGLAVGWVELFAKPIYVRFNILAHNAIGPKGDGFRKSSTHPTGFALLREPAIREFQFPESTDLPRHVNSYDTRPVFAIPLAP